LKYLILLILFAAPRFTRAQNSPRLIHFTPTSYSNSFTLNRDPVLKITSGDTIHTQTIDAFGHDKNGIRRQRGGNPLTGPFYIEGASPGDVLAVTFTGISLDREYAYTSEAFVSRSFPKNITDQFKKVHLVKWRLDLQHAVGWPDSTFDTYENLKNFRIPLHPFPGCIGVAPANRKNEVLSFFQGPYGGNLDYSSLTKGATVYLPVFHPGAYFYIGDGHAAQGDGEIAGNALETSLDITFTIRLIKGLNLSYPRAEDPIYIMSLGSAKHLEDALKIATSGLLDWLQTDFQLTLHEATQVISTTIEYTIAEIADPEQIVVAKIKKQALKDLPRH